MLAQVVERLVPAGSGAEGFPVGPEVPVAEIIDVVGWFESWPSFREGFEEEGDEDQAWEGATEEAWEEGETDPSLITEVGAGEIPGGRDGNGAGPPGTYGVQSPLSSIHRLRRQGHPRVRQGEPVDVPCVLV